MLQSLAELPLQVALYIALPYVGPLVVLLLSSGEGYFHLGKSFAVDE